MLTADGYFAEYGRQLAECGEKYEAWLLTEKQFARFFSSHDIVLRRYKNYRSFTEAFRLYKAGVRHSFFKIHLIPCK